MKHALAYGNPQDGFEFIGPFDDPQDAIDYGEQTREADWHVVKLVAPIEFLASEVAADRVALVEREEDRGPQGPVTGRSDTGLTGRAQVTNWDRS